MICAKCFYFFAIFYKYFFLYFPGVVRERATWCYPVFHIFDSLGSAILKVKGPMFHFGLCGESVPFEVTSVENGRWKMWRFDFTIFLFIFSIVIDKRSYFVPYWKSKDPSCQNGKLPNLKIAKIAKIENCQIRKLPKLKIAKLENCQSSKLPKFKIA